jgi:hypothetical protein
MAWNKSNNYKVGYTEYAGSLASGFVGDIPVQSGQVGFNGGTVIRTTFINVYNKPAVPIDQAEIPYYQGKGSVLIAQQKRLSNGVVYNMPTWSTLPLASTNFPTGVTISGYLYQPFRMKICNGGINYTVELLGRIVY